MYQSCSRETSTQVGKLVFYVFREVLTKVGNWIVVTVADRYRRN